MPKSIEMFFQSTQSYSHQAEPQSAAHVKTWVLQHVINLDHY